MQFLNTQAEFETLWTAASSAESPNNTVQTPWLVYFTKNDCAPCTLLDKDAILSATLLAGLPFYIVNQSINKYTPGFCNVVRFPTFAIIRGRKILTTITSSNTAAVVEWIADFVSP